MMNDIFERTWGERGGAAAGRRLLADRDPGRQGARIPSFVFIAEAYWDLEWALQQQGFDYCYDKRLYDRLVHDGAEQVHGHLTADIGYQQRLVRFIENHDEPRAAATFPPEQARAAAVTTLTPDGRAARPRGPARGAEGAAAGLPRPPARRAGRRRAEGVLRAAAGRARATPSSATGEWQLGERSGWAGNDTWQNLVAWGWRGDVAQARRREPRRRARVRPRLAAVGRAARARRGSSTTRPTATRYERSGDDLRDGLYVALDPWSWHLFTLTPLDPGRTDPMPKLDRASPPTAEHAPARRGDRPRRGRPLLREPVVRVGPVPERARLGHRARGLLRERRRLGLLPARPRPLARVPLERGRHGRDLGHPPRALPRARALERPGPDPEGADVRPHRAAGQPRRGRQGVLVVPRGAAEPRAAALALPLPAGRVPVRAARRTTAAGCTTPSSSCSTPARSTTTATGRST